MNVPTIYDILKCRLYEKSHHFFAESPRTVVRPDSRPSNSPKKIFLYADVGGAYSFPFLVLPRLNIILKQFPVAPIALEIFTGVLFGSS